MRLQLKPATLALAVAFAFAAPLAFSQETGITDPIHENVNVNVNKSVSNTKDITVKGNVKVKGTIKVKSDAEAMTKTDQQSTNNTTDNEKSDNNYAHVDGHAGANAQGNIGINVTAGANNVQANNSALAAQDKSDVFGHTDAETYVDQLTTSNHVRNFSNFGTSNAVLGGNALQNAQGNINANVASGFDNVQGNSLAIAVGDANLAEASAVSFQTADGNGVLNNCMHKTADINGNALSNASGNIGANVAAGSSNAQSNALAVTASLSPTVR
ncbi:MAG: hypothetical protein ACRETC_10920 [Gammaproteobacteria bacterium]